MSPRTSILANLRHSVLFQARKPGKATTGNLPESAVSSSGGERFEKSAHEASPANPMNPTRNFTASEAITNQLDKDPVLQSGVARSIIASTREVDGFG